MTICRFAWFLLLFFNGKCTWPCDDGSAAGEQSVYLGIAAAWILPFCVFMSRARALPSYIFCGLRAGISSSDEFFFPLLLMVCFLVRYCMLRLKKIGVYRSHCSSILYTPLCNSLHCIFSTNSLPRTSPPVLLLAQAMEGCVRA